MKLKENNNRSVNENHYSKQEGEKKWNEKRIYIENWETKNKGKMQQKEF